MSRCFADEERLEAFRFSTKNKPYSSNVAAVEKLASGNGGAVEEKNLEGADLSENVETKLDCVLPM